MWCLSSLIRKHFQLKVIRISLITRPREESRADLVTDQVRTWFWLAHTETRYFSESITLLTRDRCTVNVCAHERCFTELA